MPRSGSRRAAAERRLPARERLVRLAALKDGPERIPDVMQTKRTWLVLAMAMAMAAPAMARADSASVVTGSIGGTSDFVFRGLSLTRGKPAAQGSIDVEFPKEF